MRITSPEELRAERVAVMGPELGEIHHALINDLSWLLLKWDQYCALFGTKPERVDLLNKAAPLFFAVVEDTLWDGILLHLRRLTDPASSCGKANLSIERLRSLVPDSGFRAEVAALVSAAVASSEFARDWRNRRIAHSDLSLHTAQAPLPLAHASRASVIAALESLTALLKRIHEHYFKSDIDLNFVGEPGDAEALLRVLADGIEASRARWQRLEDGTLNTADWRGPAAI